MSAAEDIAVEVVDLGKSYGPVVALKSIDLRIPRGQYFVLLGPSGGGKTTLLRLIGGFIRPTRGRVILGGTDASDLPPDKRPTSMVFQSYALFPHMSVERNVAYGLRLRGLAAREIRDRVADMLELVGLTGLERRMPHELSGGQQQRVQLARSLVLDNDILLLDEPLAALDARLRKDMCVELKHIQEKVNITFLHVTHNQEEAMTVADHIAIIADGELVESAPPAQIYRSPSTRFTAEFIGERNLLEGRVVATTGTDARVDLGFTTIEVPTSGEALTVGNEVCISVASERVRLGTAGEHGAETVPGTFVERLFAGLTTNDVVRLPNGQELVVRSLTDSTTLDPAEGEPVVVAWDRTDARVHTR